MKNNLKKIMKTKTLTILTSLLIATNAYSEIKGIPDDSPVRGQWKLVKQTETEGGKIEQKTRVKNTDPPNKSSLAPAAVDLRLWTDHRGRKVKATLNKMIQGDVVLQKGDGSLVRIPVNRLSVADQAYLRRSSATNQVTAKEPTKPKAPGKSKVPANPKEQSAVIEKAIRKELKKPAADAESRNAFLGTWKGTYFGLEDVMIIKKGASDTEVVITIHATFGSKPDKVKGKLVAVNKIDVPEQTMGHLPGTAVITLTDGKLHLKQSGGGATYEGTGYEKQ